MNVTVKGLDDFVKKLDDLEKHAQGLMKVALYDGAKVTADEIKKGLNTLPIYQKADGRPAWGTPDKPIRGVSERQKADILKAFGVSHHYAANGDVYAVIGISGDGYTEGYWKGGNRLPISVLLRELESGTSFMRKIPTIRPAVNRSKKMAVSAMQKSLDKSIKKYSR
jgi:HK97 gp10 family phage protein